MKQFLGGKVTLFGGDSREVLKECPDNSIDSILTDPPYALVSIVKRFGKPGSAPAKGNEAYQRASVGFMGQSWDTGEVAFDPDFWAECLRVLKPGGHLLSFGGTRTYHRMACAIEDAGFEIRDQVQWLYGSGFPKSHDVSKGIDKAAGVIRESLGIDEARLARLPQHDRYQDTPSGWQSRGRTVDITAPGTDEAKQWEGWGTALKPANEPICLARKPLSEKTVAANVLKWGTGAINIDGCRVGLTKGDDPRLGGKGDWGTEKAAKNVYEGGYAGERVTSSPLGRFPANVIHDGSDEVLECFPNTKSGQFLPHHQAKGKSQIGTFDIRDRTGEEHPTYGDSGSAARFFYAAKANKKDRAGSKHPTVKPIKLLRYLARLITPPGGVVLDPFAGSGTTGEAAYMEGFRTILIERELQFQKDIEQRLRNLDNVFDRTEDAIDNTEDELQ